MAYFSFALLVLVQAAAAFPGDDDPACQTVWNALACKPGQTNCPSCGDRIEWLANDNDGYGWDLDVARDSVSLDEFPDICGACAANPPPSAEPESEPEPEAPGSESGAARSTAEQQYMSTDKGLYVWNPGKTAGTKWWDWGGNGNTPRLVSFCKAHNFKRAIVFIGSIEWDWADNYKQHQLPQEAHFVTLFRALRAAGIEPTAAFYLNDNAQNLAGFEKTADVVRAVAAFNAAHPDAVIAGLEGDQEPNVVGDEYEQMGNIMRQTRDDLGVHLEIGAALRPKWLRQAPDFYDALASLDGGMLMAYSSQQSGSEDLAKQALVHANDLGKSLSIAIEVANLDGLWPGSEKETFHSMVEAPNKDPFFAMVAGMDATHSADAFYVDMVIHAYHHYFDLLFGVQPDAFGSDSVGGRLYAGDTYTAPPEPEPDPDSECTKDTCTSTVRRQHGRRVLSAP